MTGMVSRVAARIAYGVRLAIGDWRAVVSAPIRTGASWRGNLANTVLSSRASIILIPIHDYCRIATDMLIDAIY